MVLLIMNFFNFFPMIKERHIVKESSNHLPILFELKNTAVRHKKRIFRFENMWLKHDGCKQVIDSSWGTDPCTSITDVVSKIKSCGEALAKWNREDFGQVQTAIKEKEIHLGSLLQKAEIVYCHDDITICKDELRELKDSEESMWQQRARVTWITEGDRNTRFYHAMANQHRMTNMINEIHSDNGMIFTDNNGIGLAFVSYFSDLNNNLNCTFSHVKRDTNGCAHNLAKYAIEFSDYRFWISVLPIHCCNPDLTR